MVFILSLQVMEGDDKVVNIIEDWDVLVEYVVVFMRNRCQFARRVFLTAYAQTLSAHHPNRYLATNHKTVTLKNFF